jgi:aspartate racemase
MTIGILGGMGPEATSDLYMRIVRILQKEFHARYDRDYPPILVFSVPIPDLVEEVENETLISSYLIEAAKALELSGADFISIPCNTAHYFLGAIRSSVKIPVLSMVEITATELFKKQRKVGLLATETTIRLRIYQNEFERVGIELILPNESHRKNLTQIILNTMAGLTEKTDKVKLREIVENLKSRGAESVILACTELPLIAEFDYGIEVVDPTEILARSCVRLARISPD